MGLLEQFQQALMYIRKSTICLRAPKKQKIINPYKGTIGIIIYYFWGALKHMVEIQQVYWSCTGRLLSMVSDPCSMGSGSGVERNQRGRND